jgi:type I restriction enzyme, R subunit
MGCGGLGPSKDELDRYGRAIPDDEYATKDFERVVALRARTDAIARHLTDFLKKTDRFAKTIVFCVDQEHASEMRTTLSNLNSDVVAQYPDYVCRVTADEGDIGRGHLSRFQDVDTKTPTILTTSQMLTTGVDAPTCKNVVLARVVGSMSEFKQIIGRGTRVRDDYGKLWFNIIDYTGSATRLFADPAFDGEPVRITEEEITPEGEVESVTETDSEPTDAMMGGRRLSIPLPKNTENTTSTGGRWRLRRIWSMSSTRTGSSCASSGILTMPPIPCALSVRTRRRSDNSGLTQ